MNTKTINIQVLDLLGDLYLNDKDRLNEILNMIEVK